MVALATPITPDKAVVVVPVQLVATEQQWLVAVGATARHPQSQAAASLEAAAAVVHTPRVVVALVALVAVGQAITRHQGPEP